MAPPTTVIARPTFQQQTTYAQRFGLGNLNSPQLTVRTGRDAKFGIRNFSFMAFEGLDIPRDAIIENAFFRFEFFAHNGLSGFDMKVNYLLRDQRWEKTPFRSGNLWNSFPEYDGVFSLFSNLFQFILTAPPSGITNANFSLRLDTGVPFSQQTHVGESFVAEVSANAALGGVFCRRVGAPVGDVWMEIWDTDQVNVQVGTVKLAESARIDVSFISTTMDNKGFGFSGINAIPLTAGRRYLIVMAGDYAFSISDGIQVGARSILFSGEYLEGRLVTFTEGAGFNFWNYGTEFLLIDEGPVPSGIKATWPTPFPVTNGDIVDSPDISPMIQDWLLSDAYNEDGIIGFRFDEDLQTAIGQMAFWFGFAIGQPQAALIPELHVTFGTKANPGIGGIIPAYERLRRKRRREEDEEAMVHVLEATDGDE